MVWQKRYCVYNQQAGLVEQNWDKYIATGNKVVFLVQAQAQNAHATQWYMLRLKA